jgi:hypothetical protein
MEREPVEKMLAEGFREIGILVLVFAILDKLVSGSITWKWTLSTLICGFLLFGAGIYIERKR